MDLQEEYFKRKKVPAYLIKYTDRSNAILVAKKGKNTEYNWLYVTIEHRQEPNKPPYFTFVVAANPVIYSSMDMSQFAYHHSKVLIDKRFEWDAYEKGILEWTREISKNYTGIQATDAVFVSWEMFLVNYDAWLANFLPLRIIDMVGKTLEGDAKQRLASIVEVENWVAERHERIFSCWKSIKQNVDSKNYGDWLVEVINDMGK